MGGSVKRSNFIIGTLILLGLIGVTSYAQFANAIVPGINTLVNYNSTNTAVAGNSPSYARISEDGKTVVWVSDTPDIVSGVSGGNMIYKRNLKTGATTVESVSATGVPMWIPYEQQFSMSRDGRYIVYNSHRTGIVTTHTIPDGARFHTYIRDTKLGINKLVHQSAAGALGFGNAGQTPYVSDDGRFVTFRSTATNLLSSGTSLAGGIYVKDMLTGNVTLLSKSDTGVQAPPASLSGLQFLVNCDASLAVFYSNATTLTPQDNGQYNAYLVDVRNGQTIKNLTYQFNQELMPQSISCNGRYIVFSSKATNITSDPVSGTVYQGYRYDRMTEEYVLIGKNASGNPSTVGAGAGAVSDNGKVVFSSTDVNLVSPASSHSTQIYVRDPDNGSTEIIPLDGSGVAQKPWASTSLVYKTISINARGTKAIYNTDSTTLMTGVGSGSGYKLVVSELE